jgi:hypothetical protein
MRVPYTREKYRSERYTSDVEALGTFRFQILHIKYGTATQFSQELREGDKNDSTTETGSWHAARAGNHGGGAVLFAGPASAHEANIEVNCLNALNNGANASVQFNYASFTAGENVSATETVTVNGNPQINKVFSFTGPVGSDTVGITLPGGAGLVIANTSWTVDGGGSQSLTQFISGCPNPPPPCPSGTSIHVRWHYSANGSSGSWSATTAFACPGQVSMGPQGMEGNLQVAPGNTLKAGYDFTIPGDNNPVTVTFTNAEVTFNVKCTNGTILPPGTTVTVPMTTPQTYTSTNGANWYPSGNQSSMLVYQGSIPVPDLCNGGKVSFQNGGTFSATLS